MPHLRQLATHLNDMLLFVAVVQAQSFAAAAQRLDMPASTLSRRITAFEKNLGMPLLLRTTRSVQLHPAATDYYAACLQAVQAAELAQATLQATEGQAVHLRLSAPVDLGVDVLAPILAQYAHHNTALQCSVTLSASPVDVFKEPYDLVFRIGDPMDDRVVARQIGLIRSGLFAAPSVVEQHPPLHTALDLVHWPCIKLLTGRGEMPWRVDGETWPSAPGHARLGAASVGFVRELAVAGHGVALLPLHIAEKVPQTDGQNGALVRLLPQAQTPEWPLYAVTSGKSVSPAVTALIGFVKNQLAVRYGQGI